MVLVHTDAVLIQLQLGAGDLEVWILHRHPRQDDVIGARGVGLALLENDEAIVEVPDGDDRRSRHQPLRGIERGGIDERTDPPVRTSSRWTARKYTVENAIRSARAQVMVKVRATMSTSKPDKVPVTGSRKLIRLVLWSTPTINRPRARIAATAPSAGAAAGVGSEAAKGAALCR
ncbi:hypothetical protein MLGJGCBP_03506 [Rhodococcus sp. T7]|nr:hypothetical protein MLGJGCBP_03506 [Rhodococcus sp. T7]